MDTKQILAALDDEIEKLTYVRSLLTGSVDRHSAPKRPPLGTAARKRIAGAQRKRWAKGEKADWKDAKQRASST
jgi:hypothetical protein